MRNTPEPRALRIATEPESPELSILVRCYNEMAALPEFWRMLQRQSAIDKTEIVVLDSGSTDGSLDYLLARQCRLYQLTPQEFNFGTSCNQLASLARAPRLMFLSAHVFIQDSLTLETMIRLLDPSRDQALYLRQVPNAALGYSPYEAAYLKRRFPPGDSPRVMNGPEAFSNAASALTKTAWRRQHFPELHGSEDHHWAADFVRHGGELLYVPNLVAQHSHNESPAKVFERVRLNAVARGQTRSFCKAALMLAGVLLQTLREGASPRIAWRYAVSHARAYL